MRMRNDYALAVCLAIIQFLLYSNTDTYAQTSSGSMVASSDSIFLADPTIFYEKGVYYLYGTGGNQGFQVYTSTDLRSWKGPAGKTDGYALIKGDSYGSTGFWAPQVFRRHGKYYMAYTANENIAIAESTSPLGPFRQKQFMAISGAGKQIDPYVFFGRRGKIYLYHVRLVNGNRIYVAEMKDDLSDIKPGTEKECISAKAPWENTRQAPWPVAEGPTVIRRRNLYYLFYSANDFRNIDYAMGYAVSTSPVGPWKKVAANPILSRHNTGVHGTGHGDFLNKEGKWYYVFHTHRSKDRVSPRVTAIINCRFVAGDKGEAAVTVDPASLYFLRKAL